MRKWSCLWEEASGRGNLQGRWRTTDKKKSDARKGSPETGPPWERRDRLPIWEGLPTGNCVCSSCLYN